jgi:transcriptional regulator with XRE-family HTH domain
VADTSPLRSARERKGYSREHVTRLVGESTFSSKTLERWEKGVSPVPGWRLEQLAALYDAPELLGEGVAA